MSDIQHELRVVPNRYKDVIQRMAVLYPIQNGLPQTAEQVRTATSSLIETWRARIGALSTAGWEPSVGERANHSLLYARNCRPTFAMSTRSTRPCHNRLVCPFCYARWVREIWLNIDGNFPAPDPVEPDPLEVENGREFRAITLDGQVEDAIETHNSVFRFHLVERHHTFYRPVVPNPNPNSLTLEATLARLLQDIEDQRQFIVRLVDPVGAFIYTTLEPFDEGRQWKIHHRQLFKMTPEQDFPLAVAENTQGSVVRFERPSRRTILGAVARVCRYPLQLIRGDAERTVQLLDIRRRYNFRGHARFRGFRSRKYE